MVDGASLEGRIAGEAAVGHGTDSPLKEGIACGAEGGEGLGRFRQGGAHRLRDWVDMGRGAASGAGNLGQEGSKAPPAQLERRLGCARYAQGVSAVGPGRGPGQLRTHGTVERNDGVSQGLALGQDARERRQGRRRRGGRGAGRTAAVSGAPTAAGSLEECKAKKGGSAKQQHRRMIPRCVR